MNDTTFLVNALSDLSFPHFKETEDLSGHIVFCDYIGRRIVSGAVRQNLLRLDDKLKGQVSKVWKVADSQKCTLITLLGEVTYSRRVYLDEYGCRRCLLDAVLGIPARQRVEPNAFL